MTKWPVQKLTNRTTQKHLHGWGKTSAISTQTGHKLMGKLCNK